MPIMLFLQPELVQRVEKDLVNIMSGGTVENLDILDMNFSIVSLVIIFGNC